MQKGKPVLVTGSTGFIGGRLVEKLILEHGVAVRTVVRDYSRAARIARFPVEMVHGALNDSDALDNAMKGCDVVFHCAFDPAASAEKSVIDIRTLCEACSRNNIKRLIHISTISVYEPLPDGDLTEDSLAEPCGFSYADTKLAVEREVLRQVNENSLPATILQPTIVYGPFSKPWTDGRVNQLLTGTVVLPDDGKGMCNPVYVDDVVNAMILAAQVEGVIGERFLISGPEPVTWGEFFNAYAAALGINDDAIQYLPREEIIRRSKNPLSGLSLLLGNPKRIASIIWLRPMLFKAKGMLSASAKQYLKKLYASYMKVAPQTVYMPNQQQLCLYAAKCRVRTDKAQKLLGYRPAFSFKRGMELTSQYIRWVYENRLGT